MVFLLEDKTLPSLTSNKVLQLEKTFLGDFFIFASGEFDGDLFVTLSSQKTAKNFFQYLLASLVSKKDVLVCKSDTSVDTFSKKIFKKRFHISHEGWIFLSSRAKCFFTPENLIKIDGDCCDYDVLFRFLNNFQA